MNNSFLKKASAVALAAVMAVTFAPAASLDVFANKGVKSGQIDFTTKAETPGEAEVDEAGTYTLPDSTTGSAITFKSGKSYVLDLKDSDASNLTVKVENGATLTIKDSKTASDEEKAAGKIKAVVAGVVNSSTDVIANTDDVPATLNIEGGTITDSIEIDYANVNISGGYRLGTAGTESAPGTPFIDVKGAKTVGGGDGDKHTAGTYHGSTLNITGGMFYNVVKDSANKTALTKNDTTIKADTKNNERLASISITGGLFVNDPAFKIWAEDDENDASVSAIAKDTAVATIAGGKKITRSTTVYAVGNPTINATVAADTGKDAGDVERSCEVTAKSGAVALTDAPDGTVGHLTLNYNNNTLADGSKDKTLTVTGKDGLSVLEKTYKTKDESSYYDTETYFFVGDKGIKKDSDIGTKAGIVEGKVQDYAKFTNGGNTLEVDVDGTDYVYDEDEIERAASLGKVVTVKAMNKDNDIHHLVLGNDTNYNLPDAVEVKADAAYTVVSTKSDKGRHIIVTDAPQINVESVTGSVNDYNISDPTKYHWDGFTSAEKTFIVYDNQFDEKEINSAEVQQIGTTEGLLFLTGVENKKATVSTTDKSTAIAYRGDMYFIGEDAVQYASNSREGKKILAKVKAAKKDSGYVGPLTGGSLTFLQGAFTLNEVELTNAENGFSMDVDNDDTVITFIDGANLGMVKTVNYTNTVFGVKAATSANITVGAGIETVSLSRFYNKITGEHFYTSNVKEIADLNGSLGQANGWVNETEDKNTFKVLPDTASDGVTVYRLHNNFTGEHLFTADAKEKAAAIAANVGWEDEGVAFKAATEGTPVYRVKNPVNDAHLFTPDKAEVDYLAASEYKWELEGDNGIAFYGFE